MTKTTQKNTLSAETKTFNFCFRSSKQKSNPSGVKKIRRSQGISKENATDSYASRMPSVRLQSQIEQLSTGKLVLAGLQDKASTFANVLADKTKSL